MGEKLVYLVNIRSCRCAPLETYSYEPSSD